jgi:hypothetical protein
MSHYLALVRMVDFSRLVPCPDSPHQQSRAALSARYGVGFGGAEDTKGVTWPACGRCSVEKSC